MLFPAIALLTAGIFIGAVWANVSWGRYWGWDPKEVWALITLMIYAIPLHYRSLPSFRRSEVFNRYLAIAFLTVLATYFGVNLLLGGMHSYA
jgi:ABC-type transport system involved in cytochrome c biogenesis permease subunit